MATNDRTELQDFRSFLLIAIVLLSSTAQAANPDDPMDWSLDIDVIAREMAEMLAPSLPQRVGDQMVMTNVMAVGRGLLFKSLFEYDLAFLEEQLALHGGSPG